MRLTTPTLINKTGSREQAWRSVVLFTLGLAVVSILDRETGSAPVQHLYYLPIIFAAVRFGFPGGLAASSLSMVSYHLVNPALGRFTYGEWDFVQMALFPAVALVTAKLSVQARRMSDLALTDDLTGLHNLRSFENRLVEFVRAATRRNATLAIFVLDLDRLKALNDTRGHLAGGEAVRTVGRLLAETLPDTAVPCRYGGDEFVVALADCTADEALEIGHRVRIAVLNAAPTLAGTEFPPGTLSVSIGIAVATPTGSEPPAIFGERLFREADQALYQAKSDGRNRVSIYEPDAAKSTEDEAAGLIPHLVPPFGTALGGGTSSTADGR